MLMGLILLAVLFIALVVLCSTPGGFASPGTGLLLKAAAWRGRGAVLPEDPVKKRLEGEADLNIIDGLPNYMDGVSREEVELHLPGRTLPARLYYPGHEEPRSLIISYHGGGFVVGSLETNERVARDLCRQSRSIVLSVAYRLAPEFTFPSAHEDAFDSYCWVREAQAEGRLPELPVWVAGDSAGANLAAAVCLMARARGISLPSGQILFYPVTDVSKMDTGSYHLYETGYLLTKAEMEWFRSQYLAKDEQRFDPRVSPLLEPDLSGLPPALVLTAGMDVLRDEGEAYAARLKEAGGVVVLRRYPGLVHGFLQMRRFSLAAWRVPRLVGRFISSQASSQL